MNTGNWRLSSFKTSELSALSRLKESLMQHATVRDRTKGGKDALCNKIQPPATASSAKGETLCYLKM